MSHDREKFCEELGKFVSQAASGAIIAYINGIGISIDNIPIETTVNLLSYFNKVYLNGCWHSYGKRDNQHIINSFDKILSFKIVNGIYCLIHWVNNICRTVFHSSITHKLLKELKIINEDMRGKYILFVMSNVVITLLNGNIKSIGCYEGNSICDIKYNGNDFFEFIEEEKDNDV